MLDTAKTIVAIVASLALIVPGIAAAAPSSVDRITDHIEPLIKTDYIKGQYFVSTSTSAASVFPYASTTALSISGIPSGNCVQTSTGGLLVSAGSSCASSATFGTTSISATSPLQWNTSTAVMSILQAGTAQNGYLSSTDWNIFNNKISSSSLSGASVISYTSSTGVITTTPGTFAGSGEYVFPANIGVGTYITLNNAAPSGAIAGIKQDVGDGNGVKNIFAATSSSLYVGGNIRPNITTSGADNVFVGYGISNATYSRDRSTFVGSRANSNVLASGAFDQTSLGYNTLRNSRGNGNVAIGSNTGTALTTGTFNTVIGAGVTAPSDTSSGQLNIGNVLFGTGLYQSTTSSATPTTDGAIGIGTTTPGATLAVQGNSLVSGNFGAANITATGTLSVAGQTTLASSLTGILKATAGVVSVATPGTDYSNFAYPFPSNATTTSIAFNGGLTASTISATAATSTNLFGGRVTGNTAAFGQTATTTISSTGAVVIPSGASLTITGTSDGCATFSSGVLSSTGVACGTGSGAAYPFTTLTNWGTTTAATTTAIQAPAFFASSTLASQLPYASTTMITATTASTTNLTVSGIANSLLSTNNGGTVGATTVSAPLSFSGTTLSIPAATGAQNGYLTSTDWTTFNNKISSTSLSGTAPITYNSSTGAIGCNAASGSQAGCLSSTDWTTFNNKISSTSLSAGAGISYNSSTGVITNTIGYPFPSNATTTSIAFNGGLTASTISATAATSTNLFGGRITGNSLAVGGTATTTIDTAGNTTLPSGAQLVITGKSDGCATFASGQLNSTGSACGSGGGGASDFTFGGTNFGTSTAATSTSIHTAGVFFASSTVQASQFPYASSTALTVTGALYNPALTATRVPFITTGGQFTDSAELTYTTGSTLLQVGSSNAGSIRIENGDTGTGVTLTTIAPGSNTITLPALTGTAALTSIAGGGTNATSFNTNGVVAYDGTRLANFTGTTLTSSLFSTGNASTSQLSVGNRLYVGGTATTTIDSAGNIVVPSGSNLTITGKSDGCATFASGVLNSTGSACGSGSAGYPFTTLTNWSTTTSATTTALQAPAFFASSTLASQLPYASTTALTVSGTAYIGSLSGVLIGSSGRVTTGVDGTDYTLINANTCSNQVFTAATAAGVFTCSTVDISAMTNLTATWPVVLTNDTLSLGFSTSTALAANQILYATAVNTFGSEAGFTYTASTDTFAAVYASTTAISSTGSAYFVTGGSGRVGIGSTTPMSLLGVAGTTTAQTLNIDNPNHTGTSTQYIYSNTAAFGGEIILEDVDGAGCTSIAALDGSLISKTVTCPTAPVAN